MGFLRQSLGVEITPASVGELCKQQRLDYHRHHAGWRDQFADVDEIELLQFHAVDGNELAGPIQFAMQQAAESLADIAVDHQEQQLDALMKWQQRAHHALAGRFEPRMLRVAAPVKSDGDTFMAVEVDLIEAGTDRVGKLVRIDVARSVQANPYHRHVMHWQHIRIGQVNRLAADLHGELRRTDYGGADALARIDQRQAATPA